MRFIYFWLITGIIGSVIIYKYYLVQVQKVTLQWHDNQRNKIIEADIWYTRSTTKKPLIIFSPGIGMQPENYSIILENLAMHNYLVLSVHHISQDISHDLLLEDWQQDIQFLLNNLKIINPYCPYNSNRLGFLGHSLGGSLALRLCRTTTRFKAGVNMDGGLDFGKNYEKSFSTPFLFILKDPELKNPSPMRLRVWHMNREKYQEIIQQMLDNYTLICNHAKNCSIITIPNAGHNSFSNIAVLNRTQALQDGYDIGTVDGQEMLKQLNTILINFFDQHI